MDIFQLLIYWGYIRKIVHSPFCCWFPLIIRLVLSSIYLYDFRRTRQILDLRKRKKDWVWGWNFALFIFFLTNRNRSILCCLKKNTKKRTTHLCKNLSNWININVINIFPYYFNFSFHTSWIGTKTFPTVMQLSQNWSDCFSSSLYPAV